jgi:hypothetical protein
LTQTLSNAKAVRLFKKSLRHESYKNNIEPTSPDKDVLEEAFQHYQSIYERRAPNFDADPVLPPLSTHDAPIRVPFDKFDIADIIKNYPTHKSGGPDNFDCRLFQTLRHEDSFLQTLHLLFSIFYRAARTPKDWNESLIFLLLKDKDQPFAHNTRPIALTNLLRRFYEKLLLKEWLNEPWAKLHPAQAGFRKGFNTMTQILCSEELSVRKLISIFLDIKAAFDRVPHQRLLDILIARGCPIHTVFIIYGLMMKDCMSYLLVNCLRLMLPIERKHGVFQGSILSPFLFDIFIDPLAQDLNPEPSQVPSCLFYADDIQLKADNVVEAQRLTDICQRWAMSNGMTWGIAKCGVVGSPSPIKLGEETIPAVEWYKYLGVPHGRKGVLWELFLEQKVAKFSSLVNGLLAKRRSWSFKSRIIIFKLFIRSVADYCLPLITIWMKQQPKDTQTRMDKLLTQMSKLSLTFLFDFDTPKTLLEHLTAMGSIQTRNELLEASLCAQLHNISPDNPLTHYLSQGAFLALRRSLLWPATHNKLWQDYKVFCEANPLLNRTWKTFSKHYILDTQLKLSGVLQHYVLSRCRDKSSTDSCLLLPLQPATTALKWRQNKLFLSRICPVCNDNFNRSHLNTCQVLPSSLHSVQNNPRFIKDVADIAQAISSKPTGLQQDFNYTVLDYLLNEKKYEDFATAIAHLDDILLRKTSDTR